MQFLERQSEKYDVMKKLFYSLIFFKKLKFFVSLLISTENNTPHGSNMIQHSVSIIIIRSIKLWIFYMSLHVIKQINKFPARNLYETSWTEVLTIDRSHLVKRNLRNQILSDTTAKQTFFFFFFCFWLLSIKIFCTKSLR